MFNNTQTNTPAGTIAAHAVFPRAFGAAPTLHEVATDKTSDAALVARVAAGDRLALRLLFARHQPKVYRFVLRLVARARGA